MVETQKGLLAQAKEMGGMQAQKMLLKRKKMTKEKERRPHLLLNPIPKLVFVIWLVSQKKQ